MHHICEGTEKLHILRIDQWFPKHDLKTPWRTQAISGILQVKMIFINTLYLFTVITFALMVGETTGTLVRIKREALKCSNSHCILHCSALTVIKVSVTLKNTVNEV